MILQAREIVVKMGFFGNVANGSAKGDHVLVNILTLEEHSAVVWPQQARDDLHGRRFTRAVRSQKADHFAGRYLKAHVLYRRNATETSVQVLELKHHSPAY